MVKVTLTTDQIGPLYFKEPQDAATLMKLITAGIQHRPLIIEFDPEDPYQLALRSLEKIAARDCTCGLKDMEQVPESEGGPHVIQVKPCEACEAAMTVGSIKLLREKKD